MEVTSFAKVLVGHIGPQRAQWLLTRNSTLPTAIGSLGVSRSSGSCNRPPLVMPRAHGRRCGVLRSRCFCRRRRRRHAGLRRAAHSPSDAGFGLGVGAAVSVQSLNAAARSMSHTSARRTV